MAWTDAGQLYTAYGLAIGSGLLLGAIVSIFNAWRT